MEPKTTIIHHQKHGLVEGVEEAILSVNGFGEPGWHKDGTFYFVAKGWREITAKRDVTGEVELIQSEYENKIIINDEVFCLPKGHIATKAKAVVLPDGMRWRDFWFQFWADTDTDKPPESPERVCERMASTVIQIWQEVE